MENLSKQMRNSHEWRKKRFPFQHSEQWFCREAGSEVGNDHLTVKGRVGEVRQDLGGQGWCEHAVRELTWAGDPVTQHMAGRVQNQVVQMTETPGCGWNMGWLSVQPPEHAHGIVLMLSYCPSGNKSIIIDSGCICEVATKLLLLYCECFFVGVY